MARRLRSAGLLAVVLATAGTFSMSAAGKPFGDVKVTTTIADVGPSSVPLRVGSDAKGAYPGLDTKVTSVIWRNMQGSGWSLTTYYSSRGTLKGSSRSVWFDLTEPASVGNPPAPIPGAGAYLQAHLIAKCDLVGVDMLTIPLGVSAACPGAFRFQSASNGPWYRLSFQPDNYPEVDLMKVTCTASDNAGCKVWTILPDGTRITGTDPNPKSLNRLLHIDSAGTILDDTLGDYYLSFSITVAR